MLCTAFRGTNRRTGFQQRGILQQNAFHAKVRAATHHSAQVMRVTHIFQRQHAVIGIRLADPLLHGSAVTFFDQEADAAVVFSPGRFCQLGIVNHVIGFAVRRHPAQRFFETRGHALNKPCTNDTLRAALEQGLTGVLTVDTGLFRTLTTQHFRIDKAFSADTAVIGFFGRLFTGRARNGTPWRSTVTDNIIAFAIVTLTVITFAVIAAVISVIAGGATATVCTRRRRTPATFSGTRILGAFIRVIITADIHHFDLAAFVFHFVVHAFLHQRCAKRADYPMCKLIAIISYKSL